MLHNRLVTKVLERLNEERRVAKSKKEAEWKPKDQRLPMALDRHLEHASAHDCGCWSWTTKKMQPEPGQLKIGTTPPPLHLQLLPTPATATLLAAVLEAATATLLEAVLEAEARCFSPSSAFRSPISASYWQMPAESQLPQAEDLAPGQLQYHRADHKEAAVCEPGDNR